MQMLLSIIILSIIILYCCGSYLIKPSRRTFDHAAVGADFEPVAFSSSSGAILKGWFIQGRRDAGIVLMHGVRSDRGSMIERAKFLAKQGYSVLIFDFQAAGESTGDYVSFGYLESRDAMAAVNFMRAQKHVAKIGIIGVSLGGAATLLADGANADAIVAEAVYTDITKAVSNRLKTRFGDIGPYLTPLLTYQLKLRLGIQPDDLSPLKHIAAVHVPIFIIAGDQDTHTTLDDSQSLYRAANNPKSLWIIQGAMHEDFYKKSPKEYEIRIDDFFHSTLH